jgi:DNA-binding XRE family transcriptional regulator
MSDHPTHPLFRLRVDRGWSRERLGQEADVSSRTIYTIEHGVHKPHRSTTVLLALALGCRPEDLEP